MDHTSLTVPTRAHQVLRRLPAVVVIATAALAASTGVGVAQTTGGPQGAAPFASGSLGSISGSTLQVQGRNGNTSVIVNGSTSYQQTKAATASDVVAGVCIRAVGTGSDTVGVTATTVALSEPQKKTGCTTANPFGTTGRNGTNGQGRTGTNGQGNGTPPGTFPNRPGAGGQGPGGSTPQGTLPDGTTRPSFATAFGTVKSVSGDQITVTAVVQQPPTQAGGTGTTPTTSATKTKSSKSSKKQAKPTTQAVVVTVDTSTTFTQTVSAAQKDLAVGACVTATGTVDSVGTVTAKDVTITQPVNGSCNTIGGGFGGGFGGGRFGTGSVPPGTTGGTGQSGGVT